MKVKEVAQAASLPVSPGSSAAAYKFLDLRVQELLSVPIKPLRRIYELVIPATITSGTVSVTSGTKDVTGNSTAQSAWASKDFENWFFRTDDDNPWYEVAYVSGSTLKLKSTYIGDTVSAGDYTLAARYRSLKKGVWMIGSMINLEDGRPMTRRSQHELNQLVPLRSTVKGGPTTYSELGHDTEGRKLFEFYPFHSSDVLVAYTGYEKPDNLDPNDELPAYIDPWMIQEGIKMDLYEMMANEAYREGQIEKGNSLSNIRARQRTIWKEAKREWYQQQEATDDTTFILESYGRSKNLPGEVMTARDHIYRNWESLT